MDTQNITFLGFCQSSAKRAVYINKCMCYKIRRAKINNLTLHLMELEKEKKVITRKEIM